MENKGLLYTLAAQEYAPSSLTVERLKEVFGSLFFNRISPYTPIRIRVYGEKGLRSWRFYLKEHNFIKRLKRQYGK